jgi:hypothetical protein
MKTTGISSRSISLKRVMSQAAMKMTRKPPPPPLPPPPRLEIARITKIEVVEMFGGREGR